MAEKIGSAIKRKLTFQPMSEEEVRRNVPNGGDPEEIVRAHFPSIARFGKTGWRPSPTHSNAFQAGRQSSLIDECKRMPQRSLSPSRRRKSRSES
jgi:hypothetical protein